MTAWTRWLLVLLPLLLAGCRTTDTKASGKGSVSVEQEVGMARPKVVARFEFTL